MSAPDMPFASSACYTTAEIRDGYHEVLTPSGGRLASAINSAVDARNICDKLNDLLAQLVMWKCEANRLGKAIKRIERLAMDATCDESHNGIAELPGKEAQNAK